MSEPLVDVGIPTHGRPRYLREALDSVLAQTFDHGGSRSPRTARVVTTSGPSSIHICLIRVCILSRRAPRSAQRRTQREPSRPVTRRTSPFSMMTIVGIPASLPAECRFSNQMQRAGLCFHIAITLAKPERLSTGTPSIFARGCSRNGGSSARFIGKTSSLSDGAQSTLGVRNGGTGFQRIPAVRRLGDVAANRCSLRRRLPGRVRRQLPYSHCSEVSRRPEPDGRAPAGAP